MHMSRYEELHCYRAQTNDILGESHPGPLHSNGTFVGRSAPEIDIFEAQVCTNLEERKKH